MPTDAEIAQAVRWVQQHKEAELREHCSGWAGATRNRSLRRAPYFLKVYRLTDHPSCPTTRVSCRF
jgi:hypothetical protein